MQCNRRRRCQASTGEGDKKQKEEEEKGEKGEKEKCIDDIVVAKQLTCQGDVAGRQCREREREGGK